MPTASTASLLLETRLNLKAAAAFAGQLRAGKPVHPQTVLAWIKQGARTPRGRLVRLEAAKIGSRRTTSQQAVERFGRALADADKPDHPLRQFLLAAADLAPVGEVRDWFLKMADGEHAVITFPSPQPAATSA